MKKAIDFFTAHPALFFLSAAIVCAGAMYFINFQQGISWHEIFVEANGLVFDLLVFGILLSVYEALREKRDKIERLKEEIDDYRGWDEKEATYRIVGIVKRLNRLGISNIRLSHCFLNNAEFADIGLQKSSFVRADLIKANLQGANLQEANFISANLERASLMRVNLEGANLEGANLQKAYCFKANLKRAILIEASLREAELVWTNLERAIFFRANLTGTNLQEANLREANLLGATLYKANLRAANLQDAILSSANFQEANLEGVYLLGGKVTNDWFEKLEKWQVIGREEIKAKYLIDKNGVLRAKQ